jgi:TfoX/Sxy family transcriptional regulator of competence genes
MAAIDTKISAAFDLMLGGVEDVQRKGVTFPYAMVNGNMFATISRQGTIGILVADDEWRSFEMAGGTPFEAVPGIQLKGYGTIPETMYKDRLQIQSWFRRAHAAAEKLPAKTIEMPKKDVGPVIGPAAGDAAAR